MQAFADLIERLDRCRGTTERVEAIAAHFAVADPADAAWALQVLLAKRRRRLITGRRLREICLEDSGLPEWLFEACHAQVGDSAETIALLWPGEPADAWPASRNQATPPPASTARLPLHHWMEELLPAAAILDGEEQAQAVRRLWQGLDAQQLLVACKLLTGGLRVGVAQGLVVRALARFSGLEEALLQHRLMGQFTPSASAWNALLAPAEDGQAVPSRPYPFFLASPLDRDPEVEPPQAESPLTRAPLAGSPADWLVEWKWDGIRGQLIHRQGGSFLWSRGEELIHEAFPELLEAAASLPPGTVLDGEVLVWQPGDLLPAPFAQLQRRLGRKRPGRALLAECPAVLVAYDLLEWHGEDIRGWPLSRRRSALEALLRQPLPATAGPAAGVLRLSPRLPLDVWSELEPMRQRAEAAGAEGLMLKALDSAYLVGRRRGSWWKHKREPYRLDAVLLYAQAGSGRRANLFTDYTFGLWERPPSPEANAAEPFAGKADPAADSVVRGAPRQGARPSLDAPLSSPSVQRARQAVSNEASGAAPRQGGASMPEAESPHAQMPIEATPPRRLVTFAKAYSGLDDAEILELDRWIRSHTTERFGPVRAVQPLQVFELAFEGLQRSGRHKSGIAVRFPRISRWRRDKPAAEADTLEAALALLEAGCSDAAG